METSTNWERINKQINKIDKKINKSYKDFENFGLKRPLLVKEVQENYNPMSYCQLHFRL